MPEECRDTSAVGHPGGTRGQECPEGAWEEARPVSPTPAPVPGAGLGVWGAV